MMVQIHATEEIRRDELRTGIGRASLPGNMTDLPIDIGLEVLRHFDQIGVEYMIVGSVASSLQGVARSTLDLDFWPSWMLSRPKR